MASSSFVVNIRVVVRRRMMKSPNKKRVATLSVALLCVGINGYYIRVPEYQQIRLRHSLQKASDGLFFGLRHFECSQASKAGDILELYQYYEYCTGGTRLVL